MNGFKHAESIQATDSATKQKGEMGGWARYYDPLMTVMTLGREKKLRAITINLSRIRPGDTVLEVGCGTGTLTVAVEEQVGPTGEVSAIDIAPEMIQVARKKAVLKGANISFREGSIANLPFPDNRFDAVICSFMIFHMPEEVRRKGFVEVSRVLKPGGHLSILDGVSLDGLVPVLTEDAFTEIELQQNKFLFAKIRFLRCRKQEA